MMMMIMMMTMTMMTMMMMMMMMMMMIDATFFSLRCDAWLNCQGVSVSHRLWTNTTWLWCSEQVHFPCMHALLAPPPWSHAGFGIAQVVLDHHQAWFVCDSFVIPSLSCFVLAQLRRICNNLCVLKLCIFQFSTKPLGFPMLCCLVCTVWYRGPWMQLSAAMALNASASPRCFTMLPCWARPITGCTGHLTPPFETQPGNTRELSKPNRPNP